jgi:hypothetical protein
VAVSRSHLCAPRAIPQADTKKPAKGKGAKIRKRVKKKAKKKTGRKKAKKKT